MEKRLIAVGSTRGPKLDAVRDALQQFAHLLDANAEFEVRGFEVESGVGHTPLSGAESMRGARQRTAALMRATADAEGGDIYHYYVGLEGGLEVMGGGGTTGLSGVVENFKRAEIPGSTAKDAGRRVFLESWAYVSDGSRGYFGRSGGIELPEALAYEVVDKKVELATAIDKFAGTVGIRDRQGAWGILSSDLISRREAFRVALVAAFAPFYNAKLFRDGAMAASGD